MGVAQVTPTVRGDVQSVFTTQERRRRPSADLGSAFPAITWGDGARGPWVTQMEMAAQGGWTVQLTYVDGTTRDADVIDLDYDTPYQILGLKVRFWKEPDWSGRPDDDGPVETVLTTDITRVHIY